jgi:glycosyltransferase involved in cell wall biosynthesis
MQSLQVCLLVFYECVPDGIEMRRVLIISTTFFPDPAVSAIRMTQWCRNLPEYGWQPHVLCRYYGFEATPEELGKHVHPDVRIEYLDRSSDTALGDVASPLQRLVRRVLNSWLLNGLWIPDLSIRFWRKHRQQILARVRAIQPEIIITTSPPHSNHDIGLWLARETGIPWIADFRDPYLIDNRFKPTGLGRLRWQAHERFRESIYRRAWLITHAIPIQARWARRFYPFARDRIRILTNGFPKELLTYLAKEPAESAQSRSIRVAGTILPPEQLLLAEAVAEVVQDGHNVDLTLIGKPPDNIAPFQELLGEQFIATGYVSHDESIQLVAGASVLVNFLDAFRSASRLLSTKLFEYLATNRPILAINPSHSERLLLRRFSDVRVLRQPSVSQLADALRSALLKQTRDSTDVEDFRRHYNWTARSRKLGEWLDGLVEFPPRITPHTPAISQPVATVVISTRNRKAFLRQPILSALNQSVPVEVIVADDGSTDGTADMVSAEFPRVRLVRHVQSRGLIVRRNECAQLASEPVIFSLDDDAVFSSPQIVEQTLAEFDHPRVGAVAIPCIDVRTNQMFRQGVPDRSELFVTDSFIGTAHAVRRDVFLRMGGYREALVHQGEEKDFCLRMMARGWVVRVGRAKAIHHYESPFRDLNRMDFFGRRNDILFAWQNVPTPWLPIHLIGTTFNGVVSGFRSRHLFRMIKGMVAGYIEVFRGQQERRPVWRDAYLLHRRLKKRGPLRLEDIEHDLPALPRTEESNVEAARTLS